MSQNPNDAKPSFSTYSLSKFQNSSLGKHRPSNSNFPESKPSTPTSSPDLDQDLISLAGVLSETGTAKFTPEDEENANVSYQSTRPWSHLTCTSLTSFATEDFCKVPLDCVEPLDAVNKTTLTDQSPMENVNPPADNANSNALEIKESTTENKVELGSTNNNGVCMEDLPACPCFYCLQVAAKTQPSSSCPQIWKTRSCSHSKCVVHPLCPSRHWQLHQKGCPVPKKTRSRFTETTQCCLACICPNPNGYFPECPGDVLQEVVNGIRQSEPSPGAHYNCGEGDMQDSEEKQMRATKSKQGAIISMVNGLAGAFPRSEGVESFADAYRPYGSLGPAKRGRQMCHIGPHCCCRFSDMENGNSADKCSQPGKFFQQKSLRTNIRQLLECEQGLSEHQASFLPPICNKRFAILRKRHRKLIDRQMVLENPLDLRPKWNSDPRPLPPMQYESLGAAEAKLVALEHGVFSFDEVRPSVFAMVSTSYLQQAALVVLPHFRKPPELSKSRQLLDLR